MTSLKRRLREELKAIGITALYFGCWIAPFLLLKSLILAEYGVAFEDWSAILIGALVLSKVVLVLEHISLGAWLRSRHAWVDVVLRTALYSLGVALVLILEKGFEARHEYGGFGDAVRQLFRQAGASHVWANTLCLAGALLGFNILSVFQRHLGKGGLLRMLQAPLLQEEKAR